METIKKNKLAATVAGVLALFGLGTGVAAASSGSAHPATVRVQPVAVTAATPPADTPASSARQPAPTAEPGGADNDNVQERDQNGPDDANEANDANDPKEKEGTEAPDDGKGEAPGHASDQGQNGLSQGVL